MLNCHALMLVTQCRYVSIITIPAPRAGCTHWRGAADAPQQHSGACAALSPGLRCPGGRCSPQHGCIQRPGPAQHCWASSCALGAPLVLTRHQEAQDAVAGGLMSAHAGAALCCVWISTCDWMPWKVSVLLTAAPLFCRDLDADVLLDFFLIMCDPSPLTPWPALLW